MGLRSPSTPRGGTRVAGTDEPEPKTDSRWPRGGIVDRRACA
jgi:hypothetical protein